MCMGPTRTRNLTNNGGRTGIQQYNQRTHPLNFRPNLYESNNNSNFYNHIENGNNHIPYTVFRINGRYHTRVGGNSEHERTIRNTLRRHLIYILYHLHQHTGTPCTRVNQRYNTTNDIVTRIYPLLRRVMPGNSNASFRGFITRALINDIYS